MPDMITLIAVFLIGVVASFIGSMVGSGGLLSIPFLIFVGLPPQVAIATNKMGAVGLSAGAIPTFWKEKKILWKYVPIFALISIAGAYIGAHILLSLHEETLNIIVGIIILLMVPLILVKKEIGVKRKGASTTKKTIGYALYFLIMVFGGFFGGGAGTLIFFTLMIFFGFTIIEANATDIIPWFLLSLSGLIIFAINGIVDYGLGFALFLGMLAGGYLGAHAAIKKGDQWVKVIFIVVVIISGLKLLLF